MPPLAAAIAPAIAAGLGVSAQLALTISQVLVAVVGFAASTLLNLALAKKPKLPTFSQELQDRTLTARQPISNRQFIYGRARVGGTYTFLHVTGSSKEYLHIVITLAGHQIEGVEKILFDGEEVPVDSDGNVTSGDYKGYVDFQFNYGSADQSAFPRLVSRVPDKWTPDHRQAGCAGVYIRLKYNDDVFPSGIPDISFIIKGKNDIYDPRGYGTSPETYYGYTANSALILADYLAMSSTFSIGAVYDEEIVLDDLIEAANICDEQITLKSDSSPAPTENRYETNGAFDTAQPSQIIPQLVGAMAGGLVLQGTRFLVRAGAYRTPTIELDEDDIIGKIQTQTLLPLNETYNGVRGVFVDPSDEANWQPTDFPAVQVEEYVTEDDGIESWTDLELNYTISQSMAQRIGKILLEEARRKISVKVKASAKAYQLQPYDTVQISLAHYGWEQKTFRVQSMAFSPGETWTIDFDLREIDANVYAWDPANDQAATIRAATTTLPNAFDVATPGLSVTDEVVVLNSGNPGTQMTVTVTASADVFVREYEVQFKLSSASTWTNGGRSSGTVFVIPNVSDAATYDVRVRAINTVGVKSAWATKQYTVVGQSTLPANVSGFQIDIQDRSALLSWNPNTDLDLAHYVIRFTPDTDTENVSWEGASILVRKVAKPATSVTVPALVGTYLIKAVDFGGRLSESAVLITNEIDGTGDFELAEELQEDPNYLGEKTSVEISNSGYLTLARTGG